MPSDAAMKRALEALRYDKLSADVVDRMVTPLAVALALDAFAAEAVAGERVKLFEAWQVLDMKSNGLADSENAWQEFGKILHDRLHGPVTATEVTITESKPVKRAIDAAIAEAVAAERAAMRDMLAKMADQWEETATREERGSRQRLRAEAMIDAIEDAEDWLEAREKGEQ